MTTVQKYAKPKTHDTLHPFLNVDVHTGAGISFTYTNDGWIVGNINPVPGQPDLKRFDCITEIDGAPLKGLSQKAQTAVFKRYLKNRVQLTVVRQLKPKSWWEKKADRKAERENTDDPWAIAGSRGAAWQSNQMHQKVNCTNLGCPATCNSQKQLSTHLLTCQYAEAYDPDAIGDHGEIGNDGVTMIRPDEVKISGNKGNDYLASLGLSPSGSPANTPAKNKRPAAKNAATIFGSSKDDYLASLGIQSSGLSIGTTKDPVDPRWQDTYKVKMDFQKTYPNHLQWVSQFPNTIRKKLQPYAESCLDKEMFFDSISTDDGLKAIGEKITALQRKRILKAFAKLDLG